ncbi:MAG: hypothetical protein AAB091_02590 [Elusimicrobiota bacterium]
MKKNVVKIIPILLILGFCWAACSRKKDQRVAEQNAFVPQQQEMSTSFQDQLPSPNQAPPYYRYKDLELSFVFVVAYPLGEYISEPVSGRDMFVDPFEYDSNVDRQYLKESDLEHDGHIKIGYNFHVEWPSHPESWPDDYHFSPVNCFAGATPVGKGYRVSLNSLVEQKDGSFKKQDLPALLYVSHEFTSDDDNPDSGAEWDTWEPKLYPGGAFREIHGIVPEIPASLLPKDSDNDQQELRISVEYAATYPHDPPNLKEAKKKMNRQLCETAQNFTWVFFKKHGPPDWTKIKFDPDWPSPKISGNPSNDPISPE